jgi:hypothetical protein
MNIGIFEGFMLSIFIAAIATLILKAADEIITSVKNKNKE